MRFRLPLLVLLAGSLVWLGCQEQVDPQSTVLTAPSFAPGGPPEACDLKSLPFQDYFGKDQAKDLAVLVRDLSDACTDGRQDDALDFGFQILSAVDQALSSSSDFAAGSQIVQGVWNAIQYNGGSLVACDDCAHHDVDWTDVAEAMEYGAFGVRSSGSDPVVSQGEYPYIWGIEPDGTSWSGAGPVGWVLIYGSALGPGALEDPSLTTGFDWSVIPWYAVSTTTTPPLLVGTCVPSTGSNVALVSHEPTDGSPTLLPRGPSPSFCAVRASLGSRVLQFASHAVPFWPEPLSASAMVGVSGSGKAREFSPFHQYDVAPYAVVTITPLPPDGTADEDVCGSAPCTTVTWTTEGGSAVASSETLRFTTEANSSSWAAVYMCIAPVHEDGGLGTEVCSLEPIVATCDGRESAAPRCVGLAVTEFRSDKTGSHRICVEGAGGGEASGLEFEATCTPTFNIRP